MLTTSPARPLNNRQLVTRGGELLPQPIPAEEPDRIHAKLGLNPIRRLTIQKKLGKQRLSRGRVWATPPPVRYRIQHVQRIGLGGVKIYSKIYLYRYCAWVECKIWGVS